MQRQFNGFKNKYCRKIETSKKEEKRCNLDRPFLPLHTILMVLFTPFLDCDASSMKE